MSGPPSRETLERTIRWVNHRIQHYYRRASIHLPARFGRREWGFLFLGQKGMVRHTAFATREELGRFLVERHPFHAYYSTAFYKSPGAPTMAEKQWLGADLIFDLDADHMEGADQLTFEEMLEQIKHQAHYVLHEFVLDHFGFDPDHVHLVFSGGRGYHIHVTDPRVRTLGSPERREIVDYVTGLGLDMDRVVWEATAYSNSFGRQTRSVKRKAMAPPDAPGWPGLVSRAVHEFRDELMTLPEEDALVRLQDYPGIGGKGAARILRTWEERLNIDVLPQKALEALAAEKKGEVEGEADEPVTADIKRLIRLPGSVHGKTGLRVTPVALDGLKDFDPLRDAVAFGEEPVTVNVSRPEVFRLGDTEYAPEEGVQQLPERAALFLILRRAATLA